MSVINLGIIGFDMYEMNSNGVIIAIRGGCTIPHQLLKKFDYKPTVVLLNRINNKQTRYYIEDLLVMFRT